MYENFKKKHKSMVTMGLDCPDEDMIYQGTNVQGITEYEGVNYMALKVGYECQTCGYFILDCVFLDNDLKVKKTRRLE